MISPLCEKWEYLDDNIVTLKTKKARWQKIPVDTVQVRQFIEIQLKNIQNLDQRIKRFCPWKNPIFSPFAYSHSA